jgi:AraC family transcriptional regulator
MLPVSPPLAASPSLISPGIRSGTYFFDRLTPRPSGPVRIAFGGREHCGPAYAVQRNTFPFVTLEYVAEGGGSLQFGAAPPVTLEPGSVYAYRPGRPHAISSDGRFLVKYFICLSGRGARSYLAARAPVLAAPCRIPRHAELREWFDWIIREGQERAPAMQEVGLRLLEILLLKISQSLDQRGGAGGRARNRFLECKTFMEANAVTLRSLDETCRALHVDASNLSRLFRRFQGGSPYQYLLRCRMNQAAREFMSPGVSVKEVAARLGYDDPYHFSRLFKTVHGIPPSAFRSLYG